MDPILYNKRLQAPIYTGTLPPAGQKKTAEQEGPAKEQESFRSVLEAQIKSESRVEFSRHAMERVAQRNVDVSSQTMERLNQGVKMAEEKGLKEPLILVDSTAYLVNVKNNRVITVVSDESLKGTVFTNIDGTVMI